MMYKYLLIDMDGTICEFHDPINGKIAMSEFPEGFFLNKRPLCTILNTIKTQYYDYIKIIFSQSPNDKAIEEKRQWLNNQGIGDWPQIFLQFPNSNKGEALMRFMKANNITPDQITIVDDDLNVLRQCEKLGVTCLHPSHMLAEYENR